MEKTYLSREGEWRRKLRAVISPVIKTAPERGSVIKRGSDTQVAALFISPFCAGCWWSLGGDSGLKGAVLTDNFYCRDERRATSDDAHTRARHHHHPLSTPWRGPLDDELNESRVFISFAGKRFPVKTTGVNLFPRCMTFVFTVCEEIRDECLAERISAVGL